MASSNDDYRTKYRPRRYADMWQGTDHPTIKRLMKEEQMVRYPRGMIFCGDYGCGKTSAARIRGMRTSCWKWKDSNCEPCGDCPGCRAAMNRAQGPDYFEMDATQEKLRLTIDNALNRSSIAKAHSHPYIPRVFFIDEAHRASPKTQETLLKDIEDHQEAIFILSTTQPDKLDPAIRKRCTLYVFQPPTAEQAVARLEGVAQREELTVEPGVLELIVRRKKQVPRDCLGALYDLTFDGKEISLARAQEYLGPEEE
ncbi:MAG TPA: AAA family ATPase [Gemmataceae bacterium]|nr:AAA family ATPase [Gemmataceae bacterium]